MDSELDFKVAIRILRFRFQNKGSHKAETSYLGDAVLLSDKNPQQISKNSRILSERFASGHALFRGLVSRPDFLLN